MADRASPPATPGGSTNSNADPGEHVPLVGKTETTSRDSLPGEKRRSTTDIDKLSKKSSSLRSLVSKSTHSSPEKSSGSNPNLPLLSENGKDHGNKDELKIDVFSNGKPPKLTPSVSLSSSKSFHNVVMEEVAPSDETIVEKEEEDHSWKVPLHLFSSKKRGKNKEDKKLPRSIKRYYKAQDELIEAFEDAHVEINHEEAEQELQEALKAGRMANVMAKASFFINLLLFIAKLVAGILSGSLSIISSVIDSAVDLLSGILIWWSTRAIRKRNLYQYPQGRTKLEPITIVVLSVIMSLASLEMVKESIETIVVFATKGGKGPIIDIVTIVIICATIVIKFVLFMLCRKYKNNSVQALAQDHRNDVLSNAVALIFGYVGYKWWSYADPMGAILICLYIIFSWYRTGWEQIRMLTGHTAQPEFLKKLTWISVNHHEKIQKIDTVRAFHFGSNFLVEVDIVLDEELNLKEAHDIGESLQQKLERLSDVERAFVHLDYEYTHDPTKEHKVV